MHFLIIQWMLSPALTSRWFRDLCRIKFFLAFFTVVFLCRHGLLWLPVLCGRLSKLEVLGLNSYSNVSLRCRPLYLSLSSELILLQEVNGLAAIIRCISRMSISMSQNCWRSWLPSSLICFYKKRLSSVSRLWSQHSAMKLIVKSSCIRNKCSSKRVRTPPTH